MKKNIIFFTFICMLLSINVAYSQDVHFSTKTGNDMYILYQSNIKVKKNEFNFENHYESVIYQSYIRAMYKSFVFFRAINYKDVRFSQIYDGFGQFLKNNPEIRDKDTFILFKMWLDKAGWLKK